MASVERQGDASGLKATHAIFFAHLLMFLGLVIGRDATWFGPAVESLVVGGASSLVAQPWALLTHVFVNLHPLEFVVAGAVLLLVGVSVEARLGRARFLLLYFISAVLVALSHVGLAEAGAVKDPLFAGSLGASAGLLTAYLFLFGHHRRVGNVPFPIFYLVTACFLLVVLGVVDHQNRAEIDKKIDKRVADAYKATNRTVEQRFADLAAARRLERQRTDMLAHMLGLVLGGLALVASRALARVRERYRVLREIRGLQAEVDARARVELLLVKISEEGIESLTRNERKFLRYASRFYRSRTLKV